MEIFGDNLVDILAEKKMTQKELAAKTGLSSGSISAYINGTTPPSYKAIINISYALDIDIMDLIDFGDMIK